MAIIKSLKEKKEVSDGGEVADACEDLGVSFACMEGSCGTCTTRIISGMENLSDLTEEEEDMDLASDERLMCQCKIKNGEVVIEV